MPSSANEKAVVDSILSNGEKVRKENLALLKSVDDKENPVEWIVSVSMTTEGWDVKNVFQILGLDQLLTMEDTLDDAKKILNDL